jgi:hypothetical protein
MLARVGGGIADWSCTPLPLRPAIESILATTPAVAAIALTASQFWCLPYFAIPYPEQRQSISPTIAAPHHSRTTPRSHCHHITTPQSHRHHVSTPRSHRHHISTSKPSSPHFYLEAIVTTSPPRSHRHHISSHHISTPRSHRHHISTSKPSSPHLHLEAIVTTSPP